MGVGGLGFRVWGVTKGQASGSLGLGVHSLKPRLGTDRRSPAYLSPMNNIWVLAKGFHLSYHNKETILFTISPYYDNLN